MREEGRELGGREAAAGRPALGEHLVVREELELAAQHARLLEVPDVALVDLRHRAGLGDRRAERLRLLVVVAQDERGDLPLHLLEERVPLLRGHVAGRHDRVEQDLDVHLVVGAVDAGRVVDRVREDPAAAERELDAGTLREAEISALADHSAAKLAPRRCGRRRWSCRRPRHDARPPPSRTCRSRRSRAGRRGRGARARINSFGGSEVSSTPSAARASGERSIALAVRGNAPPPGEISAGS